MGSMMTVVALVAALATAMWAAAPATVVPHVDTETQQQTPSEG
ncbi:hypothetical protein ROJ8625_01140 [Roseivivax jejudonensis]|uniref:Uncharacterized protein n=1 Tax=Roseivivax jejudonensis TaxID=1529041 RepID=A0A1X6YQ50_9RHOB|nr:hypothetical protein [Roseivivax jejudonensis]SLN27586.1 hypothetical protein ROJ8625_01140 [Roseivivax jejudonensis]